MIELPVSEAMRAEALRLRLELDAEAERTEGVMPQVAGVEVRANGQLAELAVRDWLRGLGFVVVHHGGIDGKPDLEVAGVRLGVKFCGRGRRVNAGGWKPHYGVDVFDRHLKHADEWAFVGPRSGGSDVLVLLGFAPLGRVLAGRRVGKGERVESGYVNVAPLRRIPVSSLDDPVEWVARRRRRSQFVAPPLRPPRETGDLWDPKRNTSKVKPAPPGSWRKAVEACQQLRRDDPALHKWILDGHPTLTEAEHVERFGKPYERKYERKSR